MAIVPQYHRAALGKLMTAAQPAEIAPGKRFLFLCFTNRSGSNFLAHLLATSGRLNEAGEFFNASTVLDHAAQEGLVSLGAYLNFLVSRLEMSGWLLAKLGMEQLLMLAEAGILESILPRSRFILIQRQDHLAQAVSRLVAAQNGAWTSEQAAQRPDESLVYRRAAIAEEMAGIETANRLFHDFFASNGIAPFPLSYEGLLAAPRESVAPIAAMLGLADLVVDPGRVRIARQSSPVKREWIARYRAEAP